MRALVGIAFACLMPTTAAAAASVYQKLADAGCKVVSTDEVGTVSLCSGPGGMPFLVADVDLRVSVTFGGVDAESVPRFQSFGRFNSAGETIEWRMAGGEPVAAILRWSVQTEEDGEASILVVSKVGSGGEAGCIAAYVDAQANAGANVLARELADDVAPSFDCASDKPDYHGARGAMAPEPMLGD